MYAIYREFKMLIETWYNYVFPYFYVMAFSRHIIFYFFTKSDFLQTTWFLMSFDLSQI